MQNPIKKILDRFKCPICKSPIDVIGNRNLYGNYCCAQNINHYIVKYDFPMVISETVFVFDINKKYAITKSYQTNIKTSIEVFETDLESRTIFTFSETKLVLDKDIFDFTNFDSKKALNRIKTVFIFY